LDKSPFLSSSGSTVFALTWIPRERNVLRLNAVTLSGECASGAPKSELWFLLQTVEQQRTIITSRCLSGLTTMVARGYVVEEIFFLLWAFVVSVISARQLWLLTIGVQRDNDQASQNKVKKSKEAISSQYKVPKTAQFLCFVTGFLGVLVNIDRRTLFGIYSVGFVSLVQLLMLCPVFCLGLLWFNGVMSIMSESGLSRTIRIPISVYYVLVVVDVVVTFLAWSIALKRNQAWYLALQIVFNLIILIMALLITVLFLTFLERSFKSVSVNVATPESKLKRQMLSRKLWTTIGVQVLVLVLGLIVVRGMVQDKSVAITDLIPKNPEVYEWNSNSWTGASQLFIACIGIRMFLYSPSAGGKTAAGDSRHSGNKPASNSGRKASNIEEELKAPSMDVSGKFQIQQKQPEQV
jgi:hypothetical protein